MNRVVVHDAVAGTWLAFADPVDVLQASSPDLGMQCLRQVEERVNREGLHAAGFISYEGSRCFDGSLSVIDDPSFPVVWFGLYRSPQPLEDLSPFPAPAITWSPTITPAEYKDCVRRIKELIREGDTYQVNFTYRLRAAFLDNAWDYFRALVSSQHCSYGAFIETDAFAVCSASPELFFSLRGNHIHSRPMKGTSSRGLTYRDDLAALERLKMSEKDRAENVMIVDMVRNDLGRIAQPGSVHVSGLFVVERYPTVFQMTSTVSARTDASVCDILAATFPPASITGAPKVRTMEIIASLEDSPRRIYTGSIGFVSPGRVAQFNVAIRTALIHDTMIEFGVGGGIVWASTVEDELEESRLKARILSGYPAGFRLLETLRWTPAEGFSLLSYHLRRLGESAQYFGYDVDPDEIESRLSECVSQCREPQRVRLTVAQSGKIECEIFPVADHDTGQPVRLRLASMPVDHGDPFLYHKTTHRAAYDKAKAAVSDCDDVLLWNTHGEITETSIANIVVGNNGIFITPPVSSGLLAGTFRQSLLDQGTLTERVITIDDVRKAEALFTINSVRGWNKAVLLTDERASSHTPGSIQ